MLLALGPLKLDTTVRTVVVGLADSLGPGCIERAAAGADLVWLHRSATVAQIREAGERAGLPVGATVAGISLADALAAGAVAVEVAAEDVSDVASDGGPALWCTPDVARRVLDAGVAPDRIIVEGSPWAGPGVRGATVAGQGPAAWGSVVRAVLDGAVVVRTTDVRAVRRVVTVTDRLGGALVGVES